MEYLFRRVIEVYIGILGRDRSISKLLQAEDALRRRVGVRTLEG